MLHVLVGALSSPWLEMSAIQVFYYYYYYYYYYTDTYRICILYRHNYRLLYPHAWQYLPTKNLPWAQHVLFPGSQWSRRSLVTVRVPPIWSQPCRKPFHPVCWQHGAVVLLTKTNLLLFLHAKKRHAAHFLEVKSLIGLACRNHLCVVSVSLDPVRLDACTETTLLHLPCNQFVPAASSASIRLTTENSNEGGGSLSL